MAGQITGSLVTGNVTAVGPAWDTGGWGVGIWGGVTVTYGPLTGTLLGPRITGQLEGS